MEGQEDQVGLEDREGLENGENACKPGPRGPKGIKQWIYARKPDN